MKSFVDPKLSASRDPLAPGRPRRPRKPQPAPARLFEALEGRLVFANPALGMNLDTVVDYSAAWTFTDAFKASRDWFTLSYNTATGVESWSGGGTPALDAKGWPTELKSWTNESGQTIQQRLSTLMYREINGQYPAGVYRAQWQGTGTLHFSLDARVIASGTNPDGTHWADLNVTPTNEGIMLTIRSMPAVGGDPELGIPPAVDPIRDIRIWTPDYNGKSFKGQVWQPGANFSPFHPLFVERLSPFKTLRFMDWQRTNSTTNEHWENRRGWDEANQTGDDGKGVALEYMVALANEIDADVWFNMPYNATDAFVQQFATYVRDNLEPGLDVNVEWSNEIWNSASGFKTYGWVTQQLALAENAGMTRYQFAAREIKRDFDVWTAVFDGQTHRLTRVVAGQAANRFGVTAEILKHMEGKYDAVAATGYFGLSSAQHATFSASTTAEDVAKAVMANVPSGVRALVEHKALGEQYAPGRTIKGYAYESGQHADAMGNANLPYLNALYAAQTHPLMYEAYDDFVRGLYENNVDLAMHYTYVSRNDRNGSWGALQSQTQPTSGAPKYRSLLEGVNGTAYVPEYTVAVTQGTGDEFGQKPVTFRVTRTGDKSLAQGVAFQLGGTAGAGDYVNPGGTIQFAAGQSSATLTIVPVNDTTLEDTETVTVTLVAGAGYKVDGVASRTTATASILDDDGYVNVALPIQNPSFETGDLSGWTKVLAPTVSPSGSTNIIAVASAGGSVVNGPATVPDGSKFAWAAGPTGNQSGGAYYQGIAQSFDLSSHARNIDTGTARLNFTAWGSAWSGDYAQLEVRYFNAAGFQVGATATSNKSTIDKGWEKLTSDASVPVNARRVELRAAMQRGGASVTDAGVDALAARFTYPILPVVDLTASDASAAEPGTDKATFVVARSGDLPMTQALTVSYAVSGTAASGQDYTSLPGTVTIPAGAASATITVSPIDDILDERAETVTLTLVGKAQYALGGSTSATATIADNDLPRVVIAATNATATEAGEQPGTLVVERLTEVLDQPLTVRYTLGGTATNGTDYQSLGGTVTIPAGESIAAISVVPKNDTTVERDETVVVTLAGDAAYTVASPSAATVNLVNDDFPRVTVTASDAQGSEVGPNSVTFTFTRTGEFINDDLEVYFDALGSATAGADYALAASGITIPAGQLSTQLTLVPLADDLAEGDETVTLTLLPNGGYTPGAPASASATIADAPSSNAAPTVTGVFIAGSRWTPAYRNHLAATGAGDATYGYRVPAVGQLDAMAWSNADRVSIRFSEGVNIQQADLVLRSLPTGTARATTTFSYDPATFTATWTLAGPLANEKIGLTLDGTSAGSVRDLAGAVLDGEWTNPTATRVAGDNFPSGNGAPGGDFAFNVRVLPGDINRDGAVNVFDLNTLRANLNQTGRGIAGGDLDGNNVVDATDFNTLRSYLNKTTPL